VRVFILAETVLADRVVHGLADAGFAVEGDADVRQIRGFAAGGDIDAVVVHESAPGPTPETVAPLLRKALGDDTAIVLGVGDVRAHDDDSPFDATVKLPLATRVLADRLRRAVRARRSGGGDARALLADIEIRYVRLSGQDHYEVLGVKPGAAHDEIVAAWDRLSLGLHPDRLRALANPEALQRANDVYARVVEAANVLRDPEARARYDRERGGVGRTAASLPLDELSDNPKVQKYLRLAKVSLLNHDEKMARVHLEFAATMEPDNPLIAERVASLTPNEG